MLRWSFAGLFLALGGLAGLVAAPMMDGKAPAPAAAPKEISSYRNVVKTVLPAVVSIETKTAPVAKAKQHVPEHKSHLEGGQVPEELRKFFEQFGGQGDLPKFFDGSQQQPFDAPEEHPHHAFGSGFIVDAKGVVLTNNHVVQGADQVVVTLADGRKFVSKDIKTDPKTDLAIVRITTKEPLPYLELGDSDGMEIGDRVLAVGAPFGLTGTVTSGIISAKGRHNMAMNMYEDFLQTDAAINPGNSGGPLVNLDGKVIGINAAIKTGTGGFQGVGLAVSSNLAKNVMDQLEKNGVVHRAYLGVQIRALDPEVAARLGVENKNGVLVGKVFDRGPAAKAGIQAGDVIVALAGKEITSGADLQRAAADLAPGKAVDVTVVRDGKSRAVQVTMEEQPNQFGADATTSSESPEQEKEGIHLDKIGVELSDVTAELAKKYAFKEGTKGALITHVDDSSLAADSGVEPGMLIVKVDNVAVGSADAARTALEKGSLEKGILLQVQSAQNVVGYIVLKTPAGQ